MNVNDGEIADSWEQDDGESLQALDLRCQQLKQQQQKVKAKQEADAQPKAPIKILKRPQSAGNLAPPPPPPVAEPPKPTVILQRPKAKEENRLNGAEAKNGSKVKSFEERERAYAEARMRIFGSSYVPPVQESDEEESIQIQEAKVLNNDNHNTVKTILGPYGRPPPGVLPRTSSSPDQVRLSSQSSDRSSRFQS